MQRERETLSALQLVRDILDTSIARVCVENPVGRIGTAIRPADQYIHPYQYGHDASKRTGLWLRGLPHLVSTSLVAPRLVCADCGHVLASEHPRLACPQCHSYRLRPRWSNQTDSGQNRLSPSPDRSRQRAETYAGIAAAMADQWGSAVCS